MFEVFNSGIFWGRKIWQVFLGWLDLSTRGRDFGGITDLGCVVV